MVADLDDVFEFVLVFQEDHEAGEVVTDEVLGAEADGESDDGGTSQEGSDGDADFIEDHHAAADEDGEGGEVSEDADQGIGAIFAFLAGASGALVGHKFDDATAREVDEPLEHEHGDEDAEDDGSAFDGASFEVFEGEGVAGFFEVFLSFFELGAHLVGITAGGIAGGDVEGLFVLEFLESLHSVLDIRAAFGESFFGLIDFEVEGSQFDGACAGVDLIAILFGEGFAGGIGVGVFLHSGVEHFALEEDESIDACDAIFDGTGFFLAFADSAGGFLDFFLGFDDFGAWGHCFLGD